MHNCQNCDFLHFQLRLRKSPDKEDENMMMEATRQLLTRKALGKCRPLPSSSFHHILIYTQNAHLEHCQNVII